MRVEPTEIPGCCAVVGDRFVDARGTFTKTFVASTYAEAGLALEFAEEYTTWSRAGVLRGLHFQLPPADHDKVVFCVAGRVLDAVVDLRVGSPTYRAHILRGLSAEEAVGLYVPAGCAHGFYAVTDALMSYKVTSAYAPDCDAGVRWDSAGIAWPDASPLTSERDAGFPTLAEFASPFVFSEAAR